MEILSYSFIMAVSLFAILFACIIFTNAIEHAGEHLGLSNRTMGSVFASIGTGLPETIVPLVAIFGAYLSGEAIDVSNDIGIGAILGSPFMISTFAFFVAALFIIFFAFLRERKFEINIDNKLILRDLKFFIAGYSIAFLASIIKFSYSKIVFSILLISIYAFYVYRTIKKDKGNENEQGDIPLYFQFFPTNELMHRFILWFQLLCSIIGIVYFSRLFVKSIMFFANLTHVNALILSLFLAPVATELPEMINSIIWIKNSKDNLAFANLSGAIVYQATVLPAIGIILTPWILSSIAVVNIIFVYIAILSLGTVLIFNKQKISLKLLFLNGIYWLLYLLYVIFMKG